MPSSVPDSAQTVQQLYSDHHGWLRQRLGCTENAADLAQDTFLRLLDRRRDLLAVREPRAYLHTIANGLLINFWRRRDIERAKTCLAHLATRVQTP